MANKEKLSEINPAGFVPQPVVDMYTCGIAMLQEEFDNKGDGLPRFKPFSPGALQLAEELQRQMAAMDIDDPDNNISDSYTQHASPLGDSPAPSDAGPSPANSD
jgi:hypothetical protein